MKEKGYEFIASDNYLNYEFYSEGPKGRIRKKVSFQIFFQHGMPFFNLTFGNYDENKKQIDDQAVSDNRDTNKIFLTLILIVLEFTEHFPQFPVYAEGNSKARNRLFQMCINSHWIRLKKHLNIYGCDGKTWKTFNNSENFEAFSAKRKNK